MKKKRKKEKNLSVQICGDLISSLDFDKKYQIFDARKSFMERRFSRFESNKNIFVRLNTDKTHKNTSKI